MSRIRTIKPDFFRHEKLYEAERASGLPLRLAFSGLWTVADREGRFRWQPRVLKLDVLPFDDVDFGNVLTALTENGFIIRYEKNGEEFGYIPSWRKHQHINVREVASHIPAPDESGTHAGHAHNPLKVASNIPAPDEAGACTGLEPAQSSGEGEGKGREQEGERKKKEGGANAPTVFAFLGQTIRLKQTDFDRWRRAYHAIPDFVAALTKADALYTERPPPNGKWFFPVSRFLAKEHEQALATRKPKAAMAI